MYTVQTEVRGPWEDWGELQGNGGPSLGTLGQYSRPVLEQSLNQASLSLEKETGKILSRRERVRPSWKVGRNDK